MDSALSDYDSPHQHYWLSLPFRGVTPGIKLGVISLVVLTIATVTRYPLHLPLRKLRDCNLRCVVLKPFVLVVQSFEKVSALREIAPTQNEPPFAIAQLALLVLLVILTTLAVRKFRAVPAEIS